MPALRILSGGPSSAGKSWLASEFVTESIKLLGLGFLPWRAAWNGKNSATRQLDLLAFRHLHPLGPIPLMNAHYPKHNPVIACGRNKCGDDHKSRNNSRLVASMALCLSLMGTGCTQTLATKEDNVTSMPNPMLNAAYSADADVEFVLKPIPAVAHDSGKGNFQSESASRRTRDMADWIVSSRDNLNKPFAIVDKVNAKVYAFGPDGQLYAAAPILLGLAKGDHTPPGIGEKPLSLIPPADRTTPAGRFVAAMGRNAKGTEILWLDYDISLSMHAVVKGKPQDRRAERLASPTPLDNRISFGCINVPAPFFENVIQSKFSDGGGIVYILPETKGFG